MGTKKLILTGAKRYNLEGKLYVALADDGKTQVVYEVDDEMATYLLAQFDAQGTGFNFFEEYHGKEAGVSPESLKDDSANYRTSKGNVPKVNERHRTRERGARVPRPVSADQAQPGRESAPIDDEKVEV